MNQITESQGLAPAPTNLNDIDLELGAISLRDNIVRNPTVNDIESS